METIYSDFVAGIDSSIKSMEDARSKWLSTIDSITSADGSITQYECIIWKDNNYKNKILKLKQVASAIADITSKYAMLVQLKPSHDSLQALLSEYAGYILNLVLSYMEVIDCMVGKPLCKIITNVCILLLHRIKELMMSSCNNTFTHLHSCTGIIWQACKDIDNIPNSNKIAYRRDILERISSINEVLQEFQSYLASSSNKILHSNNSDVNDYTTIDDITAGVDVDALIAGSGNSDGFGDDMYDNNDDGCEYNNIEDVTYVSKCLISIGTAADVLKSTLLVLTFIADSVYSSTDTNTIFSNMSISSSSTGTASTGSNSSTNALVDKCNKWIIDISHLSVSISNIVVDFGSELYVPIDKETAYNYHRELIDNLCKLDHLVNRDDYKAYHSMDSNIYNELKKITLSIGNIQLL